MKAYRQIAQICSRGMLLAANAYGAEISPSFSENFEDQECQITFYSGERNHTQLNKATAVTQPVHSGKQSCMIDVTTDGDYSLPHLYLIGKKLHVLPQPGEKLEGWLKVDPATSEGVNVALGVSVMFPHQTAGQVPLAIVEQGEDGWQKFQSKDLVDFFTKLAEKNEWNPEELFVEGWLLHLTGPDLRNKHIVVYIADLAIKTETP